MPRMTHLGLVLVVAAMACGPLQALPTAPPTPIPLPPATASPEPAEDVASCIESEADPLGQSIADKFEVSYEEVMTWYCEGSSFDDILLALETADQTGVPVEDLLAMRTEGRSWDDIWEDIGLIE